MRPFLPDPPDPERWVPKTDVYISEDGRMVIEMELAAMKKEDLPMIAEPGTRWAYCSGNCHLLSAILTQTTGTNALAFARRELFAPLGIHDVVWPADARGNNHGWGDLQLHPRDMAKLGQLLLQHGRWRNHQVISEDWIRNATRGHVERTSNADHYGYFWWVKGKDYPGMFTWAGSQPSTSHRVAMNRR